MRLELGLERNIRVVARRAGGVPSVPLPTSELYSGSRSTPLPAISTKLHTRG